MNVAIRPYCPEDVDPLYEAISESIEHVSPWLPWCTEAYTKTDTQAWISESIRLWEAGGEYRFLIIKPQTNRILGAVGINQICWPHRGGNLGYWVRKSALGQGVCTRGALLAANFGFKELALQRLEIHVLPDNKASNAVALKVATFEGSFRNKLYHKGEPRFGNCYSIIPSDL